MPQITRHVAFQMGPGDSKQESTTDPGLGALSLLPASPHSKLPPCAQLCAGKHSPDPQGHPLLLRSIAGWEPREVTIGTTSRSPQTSLRKETGKGRARPSKLEASRKPSSSQSLDPITCIRSHGMPPKHPQSWAPPRVIELDLEAARSRLFNAFI